MILLLLFGFVLLYCFFLILFSLIALFAAKPKVNAEDHEVDVRAKEEVVR